MGLAQGPPWGAALPSPRPGFSSSPQSSAGSGAEAATAGNVSGDRGLLRLGPPDEGKSEGMGRWAQKGSTPARGIFRMGPLRQGWGPLPGDWHVWHHC